LALKKQNGQVRAGSLPKIILIIGLSLLLCAEGFFGYQLHTLSGRQQQIKKDYSTLNNITFGVFSVDQWRDKIAAIVKHQVQDFKMTPQQQKDLQVEVEQLLHALINKAVAIINKPQKSVGGKLKKLAFKTFVNTDKIQAEVPTFAREIIDKVNSPASKKRLSDLANSKLGQMEKETFDSTAQVNNKVTAAMYKKYHVASSDEFNNRLKAELDDIRATTYDYAFAMLGCIIIVLALWWLLRDRRELHTPLYVLSLLFALVLLLVGLTTTMIEVEARIKTLNFVLLGQNVTFNNQVLFFQSKSILDVVKILIPTRPIPYW
jgi:hypothetical protein